MGTKEYHGQNAPDKRGSVPGFAGFGRANRRDGAGCPCVEARECECSPVMTGTIAIREATPSDHPAFARLFLELGIDDPVPPPDRFEQEYLGTTLIAERAGSVVGYALYRPTKDTVHLANIVSAPEARRTGVGRQLMTEVVRRSRALGCSEMVLNVKPDNVPAITLYESFGLSRAFVSRAMKIAWSAVEAWPVEATPFVAKARDVDPSEDERLEKATQLAAGLLADRRGRPGRVLRMIGGPETRDDELAVAVFDAGFPGIYPIRAPSVAHALSLVRCFREHARPEDELVHVMVEDQPAIAEGLLAHGATLKLEILTMRGPLP
jgi:ribosomal protein S18 acetylase RimI-like enzyme